MPRLVSSAIEAFLREKQLPENSLILSAGYVMLPEFRRAGIAGEALNLVTRFAKTELHPALIPPSSRPKLIPITEHLKEFC